MQKTLGYQSCVFEDRDRIGCNFSSSKIEYRANVLAHVTKRLYQGLVTELYVRLNEDLQGSE